MRDNKKNLKMTALLTSPMRLDLTLLYILIYCYVQYIHLELRIGMTGFVREREQDRFRWVHGGVVREKEGAKRSRKEQTPVLGVAQHMRSSNGHFLSAIATHLFRLLASEYLLLCAAS